MSTEGEATAVLVLAAPIGIGVGVGVVIAEGIAWCGRQMERYYEAKVQEHNEAVDAARTYSLSQRSQMQNAFARRIKHTIQMAPTHTSEAARSGPAQQKAFQKIVASTRAVLTNTNASLPSLQEIEREDLLLQLTTNIERNRSLLPAHIIAQAERACNGSLNELRQAIDMLATAYQQVETPESRAARRQREARDTLHFIKTQLRTIDDMLIEAESAEQPDFIERRHTLTALIAAAQERLDAEPEQAQPLLEEAQRLAQTLTEEVSAFLFDAWADIRRQINKQISMLHTLQRMVDDAKAAKIAQGTLLHDLTQRVASATNEAEAIGQSVSLRVMQRLQRLALRTETLKEDVFTFIETYQQQTIAENIATTLGDCGYLGANSEAPTVQISGDMMRITATRNGQTPEGKSDDKLITFEVSRHGNVAYDFSGYSDEKCLEEASRIFEALRLSGIYLLDTQQVDHLLATHREGISQKTLDRLYYQREQAANKLQMELANQVRSVLESMRYTHIEQSSVGGFIELDAFNGPLGYHVVLSPEGKLQVFKDAEQIDVSHDSSEPLVAEAQQLTLEQEEEQEMVDKVEQRQEKRKSSQRQQKKQSLEN